MAARPLKRSALTSLPAWCALQLVRGYQVLVSPLMGGHCRYIPSCSEYCRQAIQRFGLLRGGWLTLKRLARCHPWGSAGFDPVPEAHTVAGSRRAGS
jgi:putative membrane protein insertion efficiency factor